MRIKLAVLVSGRGSNLEAILSAIKSGALDAKVEVVLSNKPDAPALAIAREHGVHALALDQKGLGRVEHEEKLLQELAKYPVDFVVLAGYMRVLSPVFLKQFKDPTGGFYRIINIHPSLLPAFPGKNAYEDAFSAGVSQSGITVHLVDEQVDHGPILAQRSFIRQTSDTVETFKARGLAVEHALFAEVLQEIAHHGISQLIKEPVKP
ncbi:MAG: phosphoribosylglycinamide formyltransferase [Terriglobales bacterium]